MGYYTYHELKVLNADKFSDAELSKASSRLHEIVMEEPLTKSDPGFDWVSYDSMKWYESDSDMKTLSREYPEMLFLLTGDGEESDDFWRAFYKDGMGCEQQVHMCYDPPPVWAEYGS